MSMTMEDLSLLLVEPSHTQKRILQEQLAKVGVRSVRLAETVAEALIEVRAFTPHAVLSAMHLPDGKGHDLLKSIREDADYSDLAFLLVSSETRTSELEPIRQGGAVAIVPKPCSADDLSRALLDTVDLLTKDALEGVDIEDVRVLLVDDSRTARRFIRKVLSQLGVEHMTEAENGEEATIHLAQHFFDVVITDYNMPKLDGLGLVEYIRRESSQPTVPVIVVTSESSIARIAGVERAGVSAIIDKPFELRQIRRILQSALG